MNCNRRAICSSSAAARTFTVGRRSSGLLCLSGPLALLVSIGNTLLLLNSSSKTLSQNCWCTSLRAVLTGPAVPCAQCCIRRGCRLTPKALFGNAMMLLPAAAAQRQKPRLHGACRLQIPHQTHAGYKSLTRCHEMESVCDRTALPRCLRHQHSSRLLPASNRLCQGRIGPTIDLQECPT